MAKWAVCNHWSSIGGGCLISSFVVAYQYGYLDLAEWALLKSKKLFAWKSFSHEVEEVDPVMMEWAKSRWDRETCRKQTHAAMMSSSATPGDIV